MMKFPSGFIFGVATAAYQIEGATGEDGRGPSIWDTFSHSAGKVHHGDTGDIACDHYHRFEQDLDVLSYLGVNAYRFSVAWPRVLPEGSGRVNQKGLDFYRRILSGLNTRGIMPMVTLYHWDLPQVLEDKGGWRNRDTAQRFADYASIVVRELGDSVRFWVTLNEPWCSAFVGHLEGRHAPGLQDLGAALTASHNLLLAHGLGVQALRAAGAIGEVGITLNLSDVHARSEADAAAASRVDGNENRWFLDPLLKKAYPVDMVAWYEQRADLSAIRDQDLAIIAEPLDFLGVNYYETHTVVTDPDDELHGAGKLPQAPPLTGAGIPVRPEGLANILRRLSADYTSLPLYITENGAAFNDYSTPEGGVDDLERVDFLERHFAATRDCIRQGIDVQGYFVWSLFDNFEWAEGYSRRFGIVYVDYASQTRIVKSSGHWYRQLVLAQDNHPSMA
jgi:beta-glucosidase